MKRELHSSQIQTKKPDCSLWQLQISDFIKTRNEIFFLLVKEAT